MAVKIIGLIIGILVLCAGLYYLIKFRKHQATAAERPKKQKELRQNTSTLNICSKATARDMAVALHTFNRVCITLICVDILFQFFIFRSGMKHLSTARPFSLMLDYRQKYHTRS